MLILKDSVDFNALDIDYTKISLEVFYEIR